MIKRGYKLPKTLTVIIIVFCILLTGCKAKGNTTDGTDLGGNTLNSVEEKFVYVPEQVEEVKYAAMPDLSGLTMSLNEANAAYRPHTEWRIYSIRSTKSTIKPTGNGKAYYVSPNGEDYYNGESPETPFKTLKKVNSFPFQEGDVVYFECNGLWRGQVQAKSGVTYTSYGEGAKPQFRSFRENLAGAGKWQETDTKNVYKYVGVAGSDVGLIVFNEGERYGLKAFTYTGGDGKKYDATTKKEFNSYKDLNTDLHFYYDGGFIYLRSDRGNPGEVYNSIEISVRKNLFNVDKNVNNVTIDNLCFKYGGAHGVGANSCDGLTVTNCEFYWIGGSEQNADVRYGNGVEIWGSATNYTVENCYFNQIYDAAITFQYGTTSMNVPVKMENINFKDNVIEYAYYSVEYFLGTDYSGDGIRNVNIEGNLFWYAGKGFKANGNPKPEHAAHIKSWRHHKNPLTQNFVIKSNLFAISGDVLVETISTAGGQNPIYSNNIYIQGYRDTLGYIGENEHNKLKFTAENIKNQLKDIAGKYIFIK